MAKRQFDWMIMIAGRVAIAFRQVFPALESDYYECNSPWQRIPRSRLRLPMMKIFISNSQKIPGVFYYGGELDGASIIVKHYRRRRRENKIEKVRGPLYLPTISLSDYRCPLGLVTYCPSSSTGLVRHLIDMCASLTCMA
jgi:hypothetical protein